MKRSKIARDKHGQRRRESAIKDIFAKRNTDEILEVMEHCFPIERFTPEARTVLKDFFGNISYWLMKKIDDSGIMCEVYWREHPMFLPNRQTRLLYGEMDAKLNILQIILSDFTISGQRLIYKAYEADIRNLYLCMLDARSKHAVSN
tara:strand:+ start:1065 stop:1505 length:441 start_codon:yes stop_codon:yes gene_type:complete